MRLWLPKKRGLVTARELPKKRHYSTTDWDFENTQWILSSDTPSGTGYSLQHNGADDTDLLCRESTTQNIGQGRLVTWFKRIDISGCTFFFGADPALGSADLSAADYYKVYIYQNGAIAYHFTDGVQDWTDSVVIGSTDRTWEKFRVTWWNSYNLQNNPAIAIQIGKWSGSAWSDGAILYDTTIAHMAGNTKRVGIGLTGLAYYDDTEIWCTG